MGAASKTIPLTPNNPWPVRWALSGLLLAAGILLLSVPVPDTSIWWFHLQIHHATLYIPLPTRILSVGVIITTTTTTLLIDWAACRDEAQRILADSTTDHANWTLWLLLYAVSVVGLATLINSSADSETVTSLVGATALTLSATASWCLAAMPARFWLRWLNRNPGLFPAVTAGGILAYSVGRHCVPLLAANMVSFTDSLERSTLMAIAFLLRLFIKDVVFEPQNDLIGTPDFAVYIDHGCAGWEGSGLFIALFSMYLWVYRRELRFPQVLLLLPVGAALLWGLNAIRIVALILIGQWSESLAMGGFHSVAGWLLFNAVTLTLIVASRHWRLFVKTPASRTPAFGLSPATPYLAPLVIIIATSMITKLFLEGSEVLYPCRVIVGAGAIWHYRKHIPFRPVAFLPAAVLGVLAFAIWIIAGRGTDASAANAAASLGLADVSRFGKAVWIVARVIGAILVVPIAEELAFRGYLIRKLVSPDFITVTPGHFTWVSFVGSSILFGALHSQWLAGILVGMTFAVAVYRHKSIADAILAHAIANGLLAGYVLWTGEWLLWS